MRRRSHVSSFVCAALLCVTISSAVDNKAVTDLVEKLKERPITATDQQEVESQGPAVRREMLSRLEHLSTAEGHDMVATLRLAQLLNDDALRDAAVSRTLAEFVSREVKGVDGTLCPALLMTSRKAVAEWLGGSLSSSNLKVIALQKHILLAAFRSTQDLDADVYTSLAEHGKDEELRSMARTMIRLKKDGVKSQYHHETPERLFLDYLGYLKMGGKQWSAEREMEFWGGDTYEGWPKFAARLERYRDEWLQLVELTRKGIEDKKATLRTGNEGSLEIAYYEVDGKPTVAFAKDLMGRWILIGPYQPH